MCEKAIRSDIGALDDIPYELANTVANVYYRYFDLSFEIVKGAEENPEGWIPASVKNSSDPIKGLHEFGKYYDQIKSHKSSIGLAINSLKETDKYQRPNTYKFLVDFILDCYKYKLKSPQNKIGLRRRVERKFVKVNEIPGLIDLLKI
jgi:hypothetical protein